MSQIVRIHVRLAVGSNLMAASDDPLFLGLRGGAGREFRLKLEHGRSLRRGHEDHYVLGAPDDPETNVAHAEQNDPTRPRLELAQVDSLYLRKGFEPIPNVRAVGEMDDRLLLENAEVELHAAGEDKPRVYARPGPIWLGLVCGLRFELPLTSS